MEGVNLKIFNHKKGSTTMSKEIKNNEVKEIEVLNEGATQETKESKVMGVVKKHGKTALKVLGMVALGVAAFALGKKVGGGSSDVEDDYDDVAIDVEYSDVEVDDE